MELSQWFDYQLRSTLDGFLWAVQQLSEERWYTAPPPPLGEWSAAEHVYHMLDYEKRLALPTMYQWLGKTPIIEMEEYGKRDLPSIRTMLEEFEQIRKSEMDLLPKFEPATWNTTQNTEAWGAVSLYWLVCKTYQHTADHTKSILGLTLFWDRVSVRMARDSSRL